MNNRLKIGQEVLIRGYVDEIRKDTIIIRNDGGYFGTVQEEISVKQEPCEDAISRQAVLEQTYLWSKGEFLRSAKPFDYLRKRINSLPSVTPKPKTDILDKIRAEIKDNRDEWINGRDPEWHIYNRCLQIIDKCKGESEEE